MTAAERTVPWIAAGVVVWALHFGAIYGSTAFACARRLDAQVPWAIGMATLVGGAAALALMAKGLRRRASFAGWMTTMVASAALLAMLWEASAVLGVPPCGLR